MRRGRQFGAEPKRVDLGWLRWRIQPRSPIPHDWRASRAGSTYDEMKPESGFHRIDVPGYYDALVYVDRVTPTTAEDSGAL